MLFFDDDFFPDEGPFFLEVELVLPVEDTEVLAEEAVFTVEEDF